MPPSTRPARRSPGCLALALLAGVLLALRVGSLAWPAELRGAALEQGDRLLLARDIEGALNHYRSVAAAGDWRGFERVGRAEEVRGRAEPAMAAYLEALRRRPDQPRLLASTARVALRAGHLQVAGDCLRRLVRESPGDLEARFLMARLELRRSRPAAAETWLRRGLEINPRHNLFHYELALILAARSDWAQAREHFSASVGVNPEFDGNASYQLGLACLQLADPGAALQAFRAATATSPRLAMPWYLQGALLWDSDRRASVAALRRFLELQPRGPEADQARRLLQESGQ